MQNLFSKNNHLNAIFTHQAATFYHLTHLSITDALLLHQILKTTPITFITQLNIFMVQKVGETAGKIWSALSENGKLTTKELKKATKAKTEKDILLALGWLLREDNVVVEEVEKDLVVPLK